LRERYDPVAGKANLTTDEHGSSTQKKHPPSLAGVCALPYYLRALTIVIQVAFLNCPKNREHPRVAGRSQFVQHAMERLHGLWIKDAEVTNSIQIFVDFAKGSVQAAKQVIDLRFMDRGRISVSHFSPLS
jgi:hypothetical protein